MKKEYDFSKSIKNPYAKHLKKQVTLRLGVDVIEYFKQTNKQKKKKFNFWKLLEND